MIYCLDFDGTIIPNIPYKNDNQFFKDTLKAKTRLHKLSIQFYNKNKTNIITDRPEDGLLVVDAFCKKIGLNANVYSSYGTTWLCPSTKKKIVLKKVAVMMLLTGENCFSDKISTDGFCHYIDDDHVMMKLVNDLYNKLLNMKIK